ncbi:MAG TPA: energy coupling factor transporter S component ThiW [bacterium]|nr:energy coupling factor transporter S component ThiW [bacterium]
MIRQDSADHGSHLRRLVLAAMFAAIATALGPLSIPVGPARVAPFQHTINAVAGVLLGPWYAAGAALVTALLRYSLHTGSLFAFPGSPFGALVVGYAYRLFRNDAAALCEPIGTGPIGATIAALMFQPLVGSHHTWAWFQAAFLSASIPGTLLGYVVLRALRRVPAMKAWRTA